MNHSTHILNHLIHILLFFITKIQIFQFNKLEVVFIYLFFLKFVVDKSKSEIPNNKYVTARIVFLSIKFTIDTIKLHIETNKKHIHLIFSFFINKFVKYFCSDFWISERKLLFFDLFGPFAHKKTQL